MGEYNEECLKTFLEKQEQLFDEPVAEDFEEAEEFLSRSFSGGLYGSCCRISG